MADNTYTPGAIAHQAARQNMKSGMLSAFRTASGGVIVTPSTSYSSTGSSGGTDWLSTVRTETVAAINALDASANQNLIKASEFNTDYMTTALQIFYRIGDDGWYYKWSDGEWKKIYCFSHDTMCNKMYREIWMQDAFGFTWDHNTPTEQTDKDCKIIGSDEVRKRVIRKIEQEAYPCEVYAPAVQFDAFPAYANAQNPHEFEWLEYVDINKGFDLDVSVWQGMTFESHHQVSNGYASTVFTTTNELGITNINYRTDAGTFLLYVSQQGGGIVIANGSMQSGGVGNSGSTDWIRFWDDPSRGIVLQRKTVEGDSMFVWYDGPDKWATDNYGFYALDSDLHAGIDKAADAGASLWYGPLPFEQSSNVRLRVWGVRVWKLNEQGVKVIVRDLRPVRRVSDGACGLMDICDFSFYFNPDDPVIMSDLPAVGKKPGEPVDRFVNLDTDEDLAGVIAMLDKKDLGRRVDGRPSHNGTDRPDYDKWWQMVLLPNLYIGTADIPEGAYRPEKSEIWISDKWLPGMIPWFCNEPEPGRVESAGDWKLMSRYPMQPAHQFWRDWQQDSSWTYQGIHKHYKDYLEGLSDTETNNYYRHGHFRYFLQGNRTVATRGACEYPLAGYNEWVDSSIDVSTPYTVNWNFAYPNWWSYALTASKLYFRTWWEDTVLAWLHCGYWGTMRSDRVMKGLVVFGSNNQQNPQKSYGFIGKSVPDGSFDGIWPAHSESVLGGMNPDPTGTAVDYDNPFWFEPNDYKYYNEPWGFMWIEHPKGHLSCVTPGINYDIATWKDSSRAAKARMFRNYHNRSTDYVAPDGWLFIPGGEMDVYGAFGSDRITGGPGPENKTDFDAPEFNIWTRTTASFTDWIGWFGKDYFKPVVATDGTQTSEYYYTGVYDFHVPDVTRWGMPTGFDGNTKTRSFDRNNGIGFHSEICNFRSLWGEEGLAANYPANASGYSYTYYGRRMTGWSCGDGDRYKSMNWMKSDWIVPPFPSWGLDYSSRPGHCLLNVRGDIAGFIKDHTLYRKPKGHSAQIYRLSSAERASWSQDPDCFGIRWNEAMDFSHGVPDMSAADVSVIGSQEAYRKFRKICEEGGRACEIRIADVDSSVVAGAYTYTVHPDDIDYLNPGYRDKWLLVDRKACNRYLGGVGGTTKFPFVNQPFDPRNPVYRVAGDVPGPHSGVSWQAVLSVNPLTVSNKVDITMAGTLALRSSTRYDTGVIEFDMSQEPLWDYGGSTGNNAREGLIKYRYISIMCSCPGNLRFGGLRLEHLVPSNNSVACEGWNEWQQMTELRNMQVGLAQDGDEKEDYKEVWFCIDPVRTPEGMTPWFIEEDDFGNIVSSGATKLVSRYTARKEPDSNVASALPGQWSFENGASGWASDSHYNSHNKWYANRSMSFVGPDMSASPYKISSVDYGMFLPDTGSKDTLDLQKPRIISCGGSRLIFPLMKTGDDVMRVHDSYPSTGILHGQICNMYVSTWWEDLVMKYAMTSYFGNLRMNGIMNGYMNRVWGNITLNSDHTAWSGSLVTGTITGLAGMYETSSSVMRKQGSFYLFRGSMFISGMTDASVENEHEGLVSIGAGDFKGTGVFIGLESPLNTISGSFPAGIAVRSTGGPMKEYVIGEGSHPMVCSRYKIDPMTVYSMRFRSYNGESVAVASIDVSIAGSELIAGRYPTDWELTHVYDYATGNWDSVRAFTNTAYITLGANTANRIMSVYDNADVSFLQAKRAVDHIRISDIKDNDASSAAHGGGDGDGARYFWNGPGYDISTSFNQMKLAAKTSNMSIFGLPLNNEYNQDIFHTKYGTCYTYKARQRVWIYPYTDPMSSSYVYESTSGRLDHTLFKQVSNSPLSPHEDSYTVKYPLGDIYTNDQAEHRLNGHSVFSLYFSTEYGRMNASGFRLTCGIRGNGARGPKSRRYPNLLIGSQYPYLQNYYYGDMTGIKWPNQVPDDGWMIESGGDGTGYFRKPRMFDMPVVNLGAARGQTFCIYKNTSGNRDFAQAISSRVEAGDTLVFKGWYRKSPDSASSPSKLYLRMETMNSTVWQYQVTTPSDTAWHQVTCEIPALTAANLSDGKLIFELGVSGAGTAEWYMPYLTKAASAAEVEYDWQPAVEDRFWRGYRNTLDGWKTLDNWAAGKNWMTSGSGSSITREAVYDLPGVTHCWRMKTGTTGDRVQIYRENIKFPSPFPWRDVTSDGTTTRQYMYNYYTLGFWIKGSIPSSGIQIIKVQRSPWSALTVFPRTPDQGKTVLKANGGAANIMVPANLADTEAMNTDVAQPTAAYTVSDWVRVAVSLYYAPDKQGQLATDQTVNFYIGKTAANNTADADADFQIAGITWNDGPIDGGMPFVSTDLDPLYQYGPHIYYDV